MSVKWSDSSIPCFSGAPLAFCSTPHLTYPSSIYWYIEPLGWHLTMISWGICSLGVVFQFRIMFGCRLLLLPTWQLLTYCLSITWCFNQQRFHPDIIDSVIWWHINLHWHLWHFLFGSGCNCSLFEVQSLLQKSSKLSKCFGSFWWSSVLQRDNLFLHIMCAHQCKLALNWCHVKLWVSACCFVLYFIKLHVSGSLLFFLRFTNSRVLCLNSWKCPNLGPLKGF
jgi:hypothetical protein